MLLVLWLVRLRTLFRQTFAAVRPKILLPCAQSLSTKSPDKVRRVHIESTVKIWLGPDIHWTDCIYAGDLEWQTYLHTAYTPHFPVFATARRRPGEWMGLGERGWVRLGLRSFWPAIFFFFLVVIFFSCDLFWPAIFFLACDLFFFFGYDCFSLAIFFHLRSFWLAIFFFFGCNFFFGLRSFWLAIFFFWLRSFLACDLFWPAIFFACELLGFRSFLACDLFFFLVAIFFFWLRSFWVAIFLGCDLFWVAIFLACDLKPKKIEQILDQPLNHAQQSKSKQNPSKAKSFALRSKRE